ncbi:hypothetical protein [Kitasatospora camelliae]|uniref:Uncharacterized protein n=1 Tax=Kitasatospora camelliae TaxID=3156397 RepID=A0AAU8K4N0_9ACTN
MDLKQTFAYWLRGTGRRRAADFIRVVEAERDHWQARAAALTERLACADELIIDLACDRDKKIRLLAQAIEDRDLVLDAHRFLIEENDELTARCTELRMDLANRDAIYSPAPADSGPAIPLPTYDPDAPTEKLPITTLWNSLGLRTVGSAA